MSKFNESIKSRALVFLPFYFSYFFENRHRQKLLIMAVVGLIVSSFALLTLQSTMGGLQAKLIDRHKNVFGHGEIDVRTLSYEKQNHFYRSVNAFAPAVLEYELELLMRYEGHLAPIILHGILEGIKQDDGPHNDGVRVAFFKNRDFRDLIVGRELFHKINLHLDNEVSLISPSHSDTLFGDLPRMITAQVGMTFDAEVPEADMYHVYTRMSLVQNLVKQKIANKIRFYDVIHEKKLEGLLHSFGLTRSDVVLWEAKNKSLVYALRLETSVMVFLFIAMTLLVSLTITSGLLIFFDKIKIDMSSFWILGGSEKALTKSLQIFLVIMSLGAVILGIVLSFIFLMMFKKYGIEILPEVFIDRKIPIEITGIGIFVSFFVPFVISLIFSFIALGQFKRESSYLKLIKLAP